MSLLKQYIKLEISRMMQNNICFKVIGNRNDLPADVNREVDARYCDHRWQHAE